MRLQQLTDCMQKHKGKEIISNHIIGLLYLIKQLIDNELDNKDDKSREIILDQYTEAELTEANKVFELVGFCTKKLIEKGVLKEDEEFSLTGDHILQVFEGGEDIELFDKSIFIDFLLGSYTIMEQSEQWKEHRTDMKNFLTIVGSC